MGGDHVLGTRLEPAIMCAFSPLVRLERSLKIGLLIDLVRYLRCQLSLRFTSPKGANLQLFLLPVVQILHMIVPLHPKLRLKPLYRLTHLICRINRQSVTLVLCRIKHSNVIVASLGFLLAIRPKTASLIPQSLICTF